MKKLVLVTLAFMVGTYCFGQELELCNSLNLSSEQRFQNAYGIGIQYLHLIGHRLKIGVGVHENFCKSEFDEIGYIDADPIYPYVEKISSNSHRISLRMNIQGLLLNNEWVSLSFGPEMSYNYLWGNDQIKEFMEQSSKWINFSQDNTLRNAIGFGLISKVEIKNFLHPQWALCFTIRPEFMMDGLFYKGGTPVFSGIIGFTEFQLGLKYRFKK